MLEDKLTERLADIVQTYHYDNLPEKVILMAKFAVIDHIGLAIRGSLEALSHILSLELFDKPLAADDLLPSKTIKGYLPAVAMLRASASHAIDYDDTFTPAHGAHIGSCVCGAILPLAHELNASGKAIVTAIVTGYEVAARVGVLLHGEHYLKGFHSTGTIAVLAVAAACAKLMGHDKHQLLMTLGLAATQASGVKSTFGTMAKPFNAGKAAYNGMLAARLAAKGFTANCDALEAEKGYLEVFTAVPEVERNIAPESHYFILDNLFKFHAACHATHPLIEATKALMLTHGFTVDDVKSLHVEVATLGLKTARIDEPTSGLECKFSYQQVAACTLCEIDTAADETFSDDILNNERVNQARRLVTKIENTTIGPHETTVTINLHSGEQYQHYFNYRESLSDLATIKPHMIRKFTVCVETELGEEATRALLDSILNLETLDQGFATAK